MTYKAKLFFRFVIVEIRVLQANLYRYEVCLNYETIQVDELLQWILRQTSGV